KMYKSKVIQQVKQDFREPLSWRYPEPPAEEEPQFPPNFELKTPAPVESVSAICGENSVRVEAKNDLLGIGKPVLAADVTLGGCPATGEDSEAQVLIFESELHGCGSQLLMSEETFTYVFTLLYTPSPLGNSPIVRGREVSVNIQCHYQRKHDVSSGLLKPTWTPFIESKSSEESLYFCLKLMTDDWKFTHPNPQFLLGDMIKFEASVKQFQHIPLRVIVDSCVATVVPNVDTVPRYTFLGNSGCLFDSQLTGSSSQFLPRSQDDKVQFEVEAFRFDQDNSGMVRYLADSEGSEDFAEVAGDSEGSKDSAEGVGDFEGSEDSAGGAGGTEGTEGSAGGAGGTAGSAGDVGGNEGSAGNAGGTEGSAGSTGGTEGYAGSTGHTEGDAGGAAGTEGDAGGAGGTEGYAGGAGGTGGTEGSAGGAGRTEGDAGDAGGTEGSAGGAGRTEGDAGDAGGTEGDAGGACGTEGDAESGTGEAESDLAGLGDWVELDDLGELD
uniref:Zona pellucida sperm-binding protein 3 n=1 Tax=Kryptolebias marmoratus TaxID=37003 RepID=A0A3Q3FLE0_KRYMA